VVAYSDRGDAGLSVVFSVCYGKAKNPGIGERVERFLIAVFNRLNERADS
jgi:hypothetical protein